MSTGEESSPLIDSTPDQVVSVNGSVKKRRKFTSYYTLGALFRKQPLSNVKTSESAAELHNDGIEEVHTSTKSDKQQNVLKRSLSIVDLIAYGLASTLGTGILVTVGAVANQYAGPGIVISFILAGFASFLSALCYSEFAARIPVSGSAYSFAYISLGEVVAWFVGWNLTLEYAISASAVASGWSSYFVAALESVGVKLPEWLVGFRLYEVFYLTPLAAMIVILCTFILLFGMKESATFNVVMTIINLGVIFFFIIAGGFHVKPVHWQPFLPFGIAGSWAGVGKVFFSYIGFDSVSTLAGEVKNPARDLPIGIVGTLLTVTGLYVVVALILTGMQPYNLIDQNAPLSSAFAYVHENWASTVIAFGSVTTITATCLASLIGQPRIFYQMAQDGLMFPVFGRLHKKTGVPMFGTIITGLVSAVIALLLDLNTLLDMISIGTLLAFTVVCGGVIILRYQDDTPGKRHKVPLMVILFFIGCIIFAVRNRIEIHGLNTGESVAVWLAFAVPMVATFIPFLFLKTTNLPSTFKCPLVPFVPALGILMNVWFIMSLSLGSIYRLLIWTVLGMLIYFGYGIRHSALAQ